MRILKTVIIFLFLITLITPAFTQQMELIAEPSEHGGSRKYQPSTNCRACHAKIFDQYSESMHAKAFTNPVFQAQYFSELLPRAKKYKYLLEEAKACISCHAPVAYMKNYRQVVYTKQINPDVSGVTCDFCHTISGYKDEYPGSGNYTSLPGKKKFGPSRLESEWHSIYSELHTKSEFCAICHNSINRQGLEIKSTYSEWKESPYAKEGIQCQDCHMNVQGFLTADKPVFESGKAALTSMSTPKYREKLYTHRFPGAHSRIQLDKALSLDMEVNE